MRIDGTLTKWNDDRGFGFITPAQGGPEVFAHISAFPRDSQRPRLGERLSFEIGFGKDGKQQARNIVCTTRTTEKPYRLSVPAKSPRKPGLLGRLIPLGVVLALGAYAYAQYSQSMEPGATSAVQFADVEGMVATVEPAVTKSFHCDGRTHCSQMTSCAEAKFFLRNCPNVKMDGDRNGRGHGDGVPCEKQWCTNPFAK